MKLLLTVLGCLVLLFFGTSGADASLISHDLYSKNDGLLTFDSATKLEWLDLTETVNLSFNQVTQMLLPGGFYYGFRYASIDEVRDLWLSVGITNFNNSFTSVNYEGAILLISLMGEINTNGPMANSDPGHIGLTPYNSEFAYRSFITITDPDIGVARASLNSYFTETDFILPDRIGSYLVKPSKEVPEPSTLLLLGAGLGESGF